MSYFYPAWQDEFSHLTPQHLTAVKENALQGSQNKEDVYLELKSWAKIGNINTNPPKGADRLKTMNETEKHDPVNYPT